MSSLAKVSPVLTLCGGVLAAGQLGAVGPVADLLEADLKLSAGLRGAAISIITLLATAAAAPVGLWSARYQPGRLVAGGLLLMSATAVITGTFVHSAWAFLTLRVLSGGGYLLVVVVGPALLVHQVPAERRPMFFALWGSCTPAGLALSAALGGLLAQGFGWRGWFLILAVATAAVAVLVALADTPAAPPAPAVGRWSIRPILGAPLAIAVSFCLVALISVAVASLLPSYLSDSEGLSTSRAGGLTSIVAIASVPGSVLAGLLLRRGVRSGRIGLAVLLCPVLGFVAFSSHFSLPVRIATATLLTFAGGLGVAAAYGSLPKLVTGSELALANGLLVQLGSLGTLLAPPAFAAVTGLHRWSLVAPMLLAPALLSWLLLVLATSTPRLSQVVPDSPERLAIPPSI